MELILEKENDIFIARHKKDVLFTLKQVATIPTRKKYIVQNESGFELGKIRKLRNNFGMVDLPQYYISVEGHEEVSIIKVMEQFKIKYKIDSKTLTLNGDFLKNEFNLLINNIHVAHVEVIKKENSEFSFHILISNEDYNHLIISFMFAISLVYQDEQSSLRV